jgi:ribosome-associated translation inhibitor RaiA
MKIQFNTDRTINGDERHLDFFTDQISEELTRYQTEISRIEAHVSDENGNKDGIKDIRCLLEARLEGRQPIAVSNQADNMELAVSGAIDKLKTSLDTILGRVQNH